METTVLEQFEWKILEIDTAILEDSWGSLLQTNHTFTIWFSQSDPIYPNELKTYVHTKTFPWMFMELNC